MKFSCSIGSNAKNDIVLKDKTAADFHARLIMDENRIVSIKDLNTRFGTRVSGNKIAECKLKPGNEVRIGFSRVDWETVVKNWLLLLDGEEILPLEKKAIYNQSVFITYDLANLASKSSHKEYSPQEHTSNSKMSVHTVREVANLRIFEESSEEKTKPKTPNNQDNAKLESSNAQETTKIQPEISAGNHVQEYPKTKNENNPDNSKVELNHKPEPSKVQNKTKQEDPKTDNKSKLDNPKAEDDSMPEPAKVENETELRTTNAKWPNKPIQNGDHENSTAKKVHIKINQSENQSLLKWAFIAVGIVITMLCMGWFLAVLLS